MVGNMDWGERALGINNSSQKFRKILLFIVIVSILIAIETVYAVPANPAPFSLSQPDGSTFDARQIGDERGAHLETMDGFSVIKEETGWWNYAMKDESGKLVSTGQRTGFSDPKKLGLQKHLHPDKPLISLTYATEEFSNGFSPSRVSPPALAPQTGTKKALVILINFTDMSQEANHTPSYYDNLLFNSTAGANSMNNYYKEVSFNRTNITGMVAGNRWFSASYNMKWYGEDYTNIDSNETHADPNNWYIFKLAKEAVIAADPYVDYSQYDSDTNGVVDYLIIVHAGNGQESSGNSTDIWSHRWSIYVWTGAWNLGYMTNDGVKVVGYTMQAESSPLGTFAHEFGHDLGLPDLYDTDPTPPSTSEGIGEWGLMGGGNWLGIPSGSSPAHFSAWSKYFLGWVTPIKINSSRFSEEINQSETYDDIYMLLDNPGDSPGNLNWTDSGNGTGEYFLVENRRKTGYDAYLPGEGLLIWHINESRGNNSIDTLRLVDLEEADGLNHLDTKANRGDPADPWYSTATGFTESSNPNSNHYNGSLSGIRVSNISASSNIMTANLIVNWPPPVITFVSPTPSNTSTISQNYVFVNITASEALNMSFIEWNGINESMSGSGTNWSKNKTGLAGGIYTYRVWANDSGGNWNVSETRTVTINANLVSTCTNLNSPGYYTLTASIMNSSVTNCIEITSRDVVFDGAGYIIYGVDNAGSYGVRVHNLTDAMSNITVKNVTVTDWYYGIYFDRVLNGSINNNTAKSNFDGITLSSSRNNSLINNTISNNTWYGIYLSSSGNNTLSHNVIKSNSNAGIYASSSKGNTIYNNIVDHNFNGIDLDNSSNSILISNSASNNSYFGIFHYFSNDSVLADNIINYNDIYGLRLDFSSNNTLTNNTANSNSYGISIGLSRNNMLANNNASSNSDYGISLYSSNYNMLINNTADSNFNKGIFLINSSNNSLINNFANDNKWYGFYLSSVSDNNTIANNSASNNTGIGIHLFSANNNNVIGNIVSINQQFGISIHTSDGNNLTNNAVKNNNYNGINLFTSGSSNITGNIVSSNLDNGIILQSSSGNILLSNVASNNSGDGIYLTYSHNNTLINNTLPWNANEGISIQFSDGNTLSNNTANSNSGGIYFTSSSGNSVSNNTANSNMYFGMLLQTVRNNTLINNSMTNNTYNFDINGNQESDFNNTINQGNVVDGKPIFYFFKNGSDNVYNSIVNAGAFYCILCSNVSLKDLTFTKNGAGVFFWGTNNSKVENVTATSNRAGINIAYSNNITLVGNNMSSNINGIYLTYSGDNTLSNINALSNSQYGISIYNSNNNTLMNGNISMNSGGIILDESNNITLSNITATSNFDYGIFLRYSDYNSLSNSTTYNSTLYGIALMYSSSNTFININSSSNTWDFYSILNSLDNSGINFSIPHSISFTGKDIAIKSVSSPQSDPSGYHNISKFVNATNTSADSWIFLNVSYTESDISGLSENRLRMWKHNGSWSMMQNSGVETSQNYVYSNITSFGIFAPLAGSNGANLTVTPQAKTTKTFSNATYYLNLTNNGTEADSYSLTVDNASSASVAYLNISSPVYLNAGASKVFALNVTNTSEGIFYVNVTARSNNETSKVAFINTTTNVVRYGASLANISLLTNATRVGTNATYTIIITNTGTAPDSYDLTLINTNGASVAHLNISSPVYLGAGASQYFNLNVTNSNAGTYYVNITSKSNNDSTKFDQINTTTSVIQYGVSLTNNNSLTRQTTVGTNATYILNLTNNGIAADSYILTVDNASSASVADVNISSPVYLNSGGSQIFALNVTNTSSGKFYVNITASSNNDSSKVAHINTTTVIPVVITITTPANNTNTTDNYVNVTATLDNSGTAQLNWQGLNYSMDGTGTDFWKNMTGLLSGTYSFKVYANGSDGVLNVSEIRILTVNLSNTTNIAGIIDPATGNLSGDLILISPSGNVIVTIFNGTNATVNGTAPGNISIDSPARINATLTGYDRFAGENLTLDPSETLFIPDIQMRFNYTDSQLTAAGIGSVSTLRIRFYNTTSLSWVVLTTYTLNQTGKYIIANASYFGTFALIGTASIPCTTCGGSSGGSGGGGGGGGGTSGENYSNIELKEKRDMHIFKDKVASYRFNTTDPIIYVNITGNISAGEVTTMVEVLRNTSTLVKNISAPGLVYKNVNIWVGTSGFATLKNIKQGVIGFRVSNSWIEEKELAAGDIRLLKWDGRGWVELDTYEITKGSEHVYYEAVTDSFSPFAVTAFRQALKPVEVVKTPVTVNETQVPDDVEAKLEVKSGLNGILLVTALALVVIVAIIAAVYLREKKKK